LSAKQAIVVGALGVIGRNLVNHLTSAGDWEVIGLSRRTPDFETRARYISVDLLDRADAQAKLGALAGATHVFYCAYQARPVWAEHNRPNLDMLINAVESIEAVAEGLRHVHLMEGNKYYGSHLGAFKTPAREDDPPHMLPNFYYDQEQWLRQRQEGKAWTWSALRPHSVCGFAVGNPMNLVTAIAVYAAISRELGLPLRFPGKPGAYRSIYQATDAGLLARAMEWCGDAPAASNQVFNVTNTDYFRWENLWPRFAEFFGIPLGPVQTISLREFMADKEPLWRGMVAKYGLRDIPYADLAAWPFADFVFGCDWDVMTDTLKLRMAGFHDCVRSDEMFLRLFQEFRAMRVIP